MAQPRDYTRQYNFKDYQATTPADPLPGLQVDAELNSVKLTLDDLNTNIAKIQRDDGKLGNQAVHKDAFDPGALALINVTGFTPKGDWATATTYAVGDIVDFNSGTYLATAAHTSSAAFATDSTANKWILIANAAISGTSSAVDKFEGDGTTTVFTLTYSYASTTSVQVFVNGELLNPTDDYTISGNQLTLFTAPGLPTVTGNENVIIWGASVVGQAAANAASGSASNASGFADEADNWARKTTGLVESADYSSKAYAIGGTGVDAGSGSAKDWATKTSSTVGNTSEYSSKYWATQGNVPIVAAGITNINTVAGQISPTNNIGTLAGINAAISTVSGISSDVTTVSGISSDVTAVAALSSTNLNTVATNIASVNTVSSNITHVVKVAQDLNEAISEVETVANDLNETTSEIEVVANAIANVNNVGTNIASVNTVSGISSDVTAVASIQSNISTIAASAATANINTVAGDLTGSNNIGAVAGAIANVNLTGGSITSVNTVANNLTSVNQFANQYVISSTTPSSPNAGLLWFDTSTGVDTMKVYNGSSFQNAGSSVNGTSSRGSFTATAGQTTFTTTGYDSGYIDIWANGVKQIVGTDVTATNGTTFVFASGLAANDVVEYVAYGTFALADHYNKTNSDARYAQLSGSGGVILGSNWTVTESGGSLYFSTGGTNKMKLDASGNLDVVGSVNSNATIT